jgi:hypothetical protein
MSLYQPGQLDPTPTRAWPAVATNPTDLFRLEVALFEAEISQAARGAGAPLPVRVGSPVREPDRHDPGVDPA